MKREGWETVVVAATGPSFSEEQAEVIEKAQRAGRCRVLAVNDAYRRLPHADVLYAADARWWDIHLPLLRAQGFAGEMWTQSERAMPGYFAKPHARTGVAGPAKLDMHWINCRDTIGLATTPGLIHGGRSSGHMAINLGYHFGGRRFILVGFDNRYEPNGLAHFFGDHPKGLQQETPFERMRDTIFPRLASDLSMLGVDVVNATISTALTCFKRGDLAQALWTR